MNGIKWLKNGMPATQDAHLDVMSLENVNKARRFHESFPQYGKTPLADVSNRAKAGGIKGAFVKDESYRFGLNAFKVLGGSFAMARYIAQRVGCDVSELPYDKLISNELREKFGQAVFCTATDGNHGRGVAWAANRLRQQAIVFMPKGTVKVRLDNILKENARATIEEVNYDECVRMATAEAAKHENGVVIQDTAWDGYEEIPAWIMQGYGTMASEAAEQLKAAGHERPTHIFIQAGVGSLAGAVTGYFANLYKGNEPTVVVVEPDKAACLYKSAAGENGVQDGKIRFVEGDMPTIMAGLACGEPNTISWDILKNHAAFFVECPDEIAAKGMRTLGAPERGDDRVISGESGAVTSGLLAELLEGGCPELRDAIGLDENSVVLCFSTEGDTDPQNYRKIVWDGRYPSER